MHLINHQHKKAFTLIEVVVAVAIFAVISSIIFPALIQFLDARERILEKNAQISELQRLFLFLERDLRYVSNRVGKDLYGDLNKSSMTIGDDSLLEMTALYPDFRALGTSIPRRVVWTLEDKELVRKQYPVMDPDGDTKAVTRILLSNVRGVEIVVSAIEDGRSSESKRWVEEERLPDYIDIKIELENSLVYQRQLTMPSGANESR